QPVALGIPAHVCRGWTAHKHSRPHETGVAAVGSRRPGRMCDSGPDAGDGPAGRAEVRSVIAGRSPCEEAWRRLQAPFFRRYCRVANGRYLMAPGLNSADKSVAT